MSALLAVKNLQKSRSHADLLKKSEDDIDLDLLVNTEWSKTKFGYPISNDLRIDKHAPDMILSSWVRERRAELSNKKRKHQPMKKCFSAADLELK